MQIQFKQREIEQALKLYLESKGFDLKGKTVQMSFTTTRRPTEVMAEVSIDEAFIPGFSDASPTDEDSTAEKSAMETASQEGLQLVKASETADDDSQADKDVKPQGDQDSVQAEAKKTTSLFGG